jgi:hypothetical protein
MIGRIPWRKLVLAALCLVPVGCESLRSRHQKDDDEMMSRAAGKDESGPSQKIIGGSPDDPTPSTFFKSNRRAGGWSSEAREIESHFGAN